MVMPGDNTTITGELITPVALEKGARFAIREGGRTVGAGIESRIGSDGSMRVSRCDDGSYERHHSLACGECKRRNYSTTKNKKKTTERLGVQQVLPLLPEAHGAQGDEVAWSRLGCAVTMTNCQTSRSVAQLVEHRSPKPGAGGSSPS